LMDARAVWDGRSTTYTLSDSPRFTLLDYNGPAIQPALLDSVLAAAEWHSPHVRIRVAENASYGQFSIESLAALPAPGSSQPPATTTGPAPPPSAAVVPATTKSLLYGSSDTTLASTLQLRPWTVIARAGYHISGGADPAARVFLPLSQGPFVEGTADTKVDSRDHLTTVARASATSFSNTVISTGTTASGTPSETAATSSGSNDLLITIEERWRHQWARRTETMLAAGWYAANTQVGNAPQMFASNAVAEAALDQRFERGRNVTLFRVDVRLAPLVNPLTGVVDEQIRGTLAGGWTHHRYGLRAFVSAGGSTHQGTSVSDRLAMGEIDAAYTVSEALTFDFGVRALYQEQNGPGPVGGPPIVEGTLAQGVVFVAVTVNPVKVRF